MSSHRSAMAVLVLLLAGRAIGSDQPPRNPYEHDSIVSGRVQRVHAPRLFTLTTDIPKGEELLVFVPNAEATPIVGTTIFARGVFRWFGDAGIESSEDWSRVDAEAREELASLPVMVAISAVTSTRRELAGRRLPFDSPRLAQGTPPASRPTLQTERPPATRRNEPPMVVRPGTLADHLNSLGGRFVQMWNARVVGVFDPHVFLVDPQNTLAPLVDRSRVLVFVDAGTLRVDPESLVGSTVMVSGVVRTLLGMKVTREVPWPAALTPQMVEHLDIRAAFLARSVRTADNVELTVPSATPASTPAPAPTPALRRAEDLAARNRK